MNSRVQNTPFVGMVFLVLFVAIALTNPLGSEIGDRYFQKIAALNTAIEAGNHHIAVYKALHDFNISSADCQMIKVESIREKTEEGEGISARTNYEQIVRIDPKQYAFRSAKFLASILAHETTHCQQHERVYQLFLAMNPRWAAELGEFHSLKELAAQADNVKWQGAVNELASFARNFDQEYGEILEMQAGLKAFALEGIMPKDTLSPQKASEEFRYHFRYLMSSFMGYYHRRARLGVPADKICDLPDSAPNIFREEFINVCQSTKAILAKYSHLVPR